MSKRQTVFFTSVDLMNTEHIDPNEIDLGAPRLAWYHQKNVEETSEHGIGSTSKLLKRRDLSSIEHDRTPSSFTTHSQLIVFRKLLGRKLEKSYTRKYMRHLGLLRRSP